MGFLMGFELILSCFFVDFVDCGGRPVIVGWCCVCSNTERVEQREEMRGIEV